MLEPGNKLEELGFMGFGRQETNRFSRTGLCNEIEIAHTL